MGPFGFQYRKPAFPQLLKTLGIPDTSEHGRDLKDALIGLGKKHLNVKLTSTVQTTALRKIRAKLENDFPDLFDKDDKEKKLHFALRAIKCNHDHRHYSARDQTRRRKKTTAHYHRGGSNLIDLTDMKSDDSGEVIIVSKSGSGALHSQVDAETPSASLQHLTIKKFLEACEPPMDQFLQAFIDFGCTTDQYLLSFAMFSPEKRNMVLRRLLSTCSDEKGATEMEIAILDDHFPAYFS